MAQFQSSRVSKRFLPKAPKMVREIPKRKQQILAKRKERSIQRFNIEIRATRETFLIICEGENTEPDYFNEFKLTSAQVESIGEGRNTLSLVKRAIQIREERNLKDQKFDQYWVVFDKDDFTIADFNAAVTLAIKSGFNVAYSNQAFEYWFLLHFKRHEGKIHRSTYAKALSKHLGFDYSKEENTSSKMFNALLPFQKTAIKNAKSIYDSFGNPHASPGVEESSTTVFKLVEELRKYL